MALGKPIPNGRTGHVNAYWRLTGIAVDAHSGNVQLVLSGYADAAARAAGRQPDDRRDWQLGPGAYALLAARPPQGASVYEVIATASYAVIVGQRRPIPDGTLLHPDGSITLPNGECFPEEAIERSDESAWTVPSEFADAAIV